jgi:hypothetical protein
LGFLLKRSRLLKIKYLKFDFEYVIIKEKGAEEMIGIYKFTNKLNGMSYIG